MKVEEAIHSLFNYCCCFVVIHFGVVSPLNGWAVRWLAPVTNTVRIGCHGFKSRLARAVFSLRVASIYGAGCLAVMFP